MYVNYNWKTVLFFYFTWCVLTTLWSEVPVLSFAKSSMFVINSIAMISAGSLWVIRFGYNRAIDWLFLILITTLISGLFGGSGADASWYTGLTGNPNAFGFLAAITSPLTLLKLYQNKKNTWLFLMWIGIVLTDIHFIVSSYSRSAIAIFLCVLGFFVLSLPLSKKILVTLLSFFCIVFILVMLPVSYLESIVGTRLFKSGTILTDYSLNNHSLNKITQSRNHIWELSIKNAERGGILGAGFAINIGEKYIFNKGLSSAHYGTEKGNSQLAIIEETGIIGLFLYAIILISFFSYAIPYYLQLKGHDRVVMGIVLGSIVGLLAESIVEGWWDSAAGPEVICFWSFVGVIQGMIYLQKRR